MRDSVIINLRILRDFNLYILSDNINLRILEDFDLYILNDKRPHGFGFGTKGFRFQGLGFDHEEFSH